MARPVESKPTLTLLEAPPAVAPGESVELTLLRGSESAKMCLVWHDESGDWQEQNFSYASAQAA